MQKYHVKHLSGQCLDIQNKFSNYFLVKMCQILITIPPPIYLRIFFLLTIRKLSIHMVYARISHPKFFIALHFFFLRTTSPFSLLHIYI